jgi:hypothetical protein
MTETTRCLACRDDNHNLCPGQRLTGRLIPDPDPYRERTRLVAEWARCECDCRKAAA